ncbi:hypothetical protein BDP55DRAFT_638768 [Colletotrichum godetiae]|uniref:Uncharacterized protein n=1 Tax=Colletotrichum godetiae TaxID=1209918 RepID=A0AAJ0EMG3_9PEZI|nr:uncharacterized protein BDP55DRAFT_638768 [Colletotrichum godetiae]KAK1657436.1 hypothetical protein BDP55DRAFT_638768 [Colletotrichum godetiae]
MVNLSPAAGTFLNFLIRLLLPHSVAVSTSSTLRTPSQRVVKTNSHHRGCILCFSSPAHCLTLPLSYALIRVHIAKKPQILCDLHIQVFLTTPTSTQLTSEHRATVDRLAKMYLDSQTVDIVEVLKEKAALNARLEEATKKLAATMEDFEIEKQERTKADVEANNPMMQSMNPEPIELMVTEHYVHRSSSSGRADSAT